MLQEIQARSAAEKLSERLNIKMDQYLPEGSSATRYANPSLGHVKLISSTQTKFEHLHVIFVIHENNCPLALRYMAYEAHIIYQ